MLTVLIHCPFFCCVESQDLSKVKQTPKKNKQRLSTIWRRLMIITHQLSFPHKSVTPWAGLVQTKDFGFGSKQKDNNLCVNGAPCSAECLHSASIWVICFRGRGWIRARVSVCENLTTALSSEITVMQETTSTAGLAPPQRSTKNRA